MQRNLQRFKQVREEIEVGEMSGAVGTFANIPPEIESYACKHLVLAQRLYQRKHCNAIDMHTILRHYNDRDVTRKICCSNS